MKIRPAARPARPPKPHLTDEYRAYLKTAERTAGGPFTCYNVDSSKVPARPCRGRRRGTRMEVRMLEQSSSSSPAPEEWRAIAGYEGLYEVSDLGRVRSLRSRGNGTFGAWDRLRPEPLVRRPKRNRRGYVVVAIGDGTRPVHQLVLEAFVGPRPFGYVTGHLNGQPADNRLVNLAWITSSENQQHRFLHGTMATGDESFPRQHPERYPRGDRSFARLHPERLARGERGGNAKLTVAQVLAIRAASADGEPQRAIATRYEVSQATINHIVTRRKWAHV